MFASFRPAALNLSAPKQVSYHLVAAVLRAFAILSVLCLTLGIAMGQGPEKNRLIYRSLDGHALVKILAVKTKKQVVKYVQEFLEDDDWLNGLTVVLANTSGKPVTHIDVELTFPRRENQSQGLPAVWDLEYGTSPFQEKTLTAGERPQVKPILPGETFELTIPEITYDGLKRFLKDVNFPESVGYVELRVTEITFSDGTAWNNGRMYRPDPGARFGMSPIEVGKPEISPCRAGR